MTTLDRMSPVDSYFLYAEDDGVNHMHLGGFAVVEGPPVDHDLLRTMIESKLDLIPRYRDVVAFVPLHLGRPVWVDDPHFDIDFHVRRTALPGRGGEDELRALIERVMAQRLDRSRPLWELWIVENVESENWAVIWKIHHCMVDGVSGTELLTVLFDQTPQPADRQPAPWEPERSPSPAQLAVDAIGDLARSPYEQGRALRSALRSPRTLLQHATTALGAGTRLARPNPVSTFNGPVGPSRRYAYSSVPMADIKAIRDRLGGTVNDIVLAALTRAFRDLLVERGESVEQTIRTLVPVATRTRTDSGLAVGDGTYTNKAVVITAELPVGVADPIERLDLVRQQMEGLKRSGQAEAAGALSQYSDHAPGMLLALGVRAAARANQQHVNTTATNVPGPQTPLYLHGRQLLSMYAYAPLFPVGSRVTTAIYSYNGTLHFGVTGDHATMPDVDTLAEGIIRGLDELTNAH